MVCLALCFDSVVDTVLQLGGPLIEPLRVYLRHLRGFLRRPL
jgi:hypothetical protein